MLYPEFNYTDPRIYHVSTADPITLFWLCCESIPHFFRRFASQRPDYRFPFSFLDDLGRVTLSPTELVTVISLSFAFTFLRYLLTLYSKSWIRTHNISPLYSHKLPESIWKLICYGGIWCFAFYIHRIEGKVNTFEDPLSMWKDWQSGNTPPMIPSVTVFYCIQSAFYIHSIYATLFMDLWRKDSWIMFIHHFIALALLYLSYVDNYTLAGALVLFLQDNSDAALEITKICVYTKKRENGDYYPMVSFLGNVIFVGFALLWIVFRLYWYPCKLLYATIYGAVYLGPQNAPFFPILAVMLISVYILNVYWFNFIARMCIRVWQTGEEPEDNREYDTTSVCGKTTEERLKEMRRRKNE